MPVITLKDFNTGGIANSDYQGTANSLAEINGIDLHNEGGIMQAYQDIAQYPTSQALGGPGLIREIAGEVYLFSPTKIFVYDGGLGEFTYVRALGSITPTAAEVHGDYVYFADDDTSVWRVLTASLESSGISEWQTTLDTYDNDFGREMFKKNNILFISNNNKVATIDATPTFTADALDLETEFNITALTDFQDNLAIAASDGVYSKIYRWDTFSVSWFNVAIVPEKKVGAMLRDATGGVLAFTEGIGSIYFYNGVTAQWIKAIKGDWSENGDILIKPGAVENYNREVLFGLSKGADASAEIPKGIYSYSRTGPDYPRVLSVLKELANSKTYDIKNTTEGLFITINSAVYKIDTSTRTTTSYFSTRVIDLERSNLKIFKVAVNYKKDISVTNITMYKKVDGEAAWVLVETINNTVNDRIEAEFNIEDASTLQIKVVLTSSGSDTPEIESLTIEY